MHEFHNEAGISPILISPFEPRDNHVVNMPEGSPLAEYLYQNFPLVRDMLAISSHSKIQKTPILLSKNPLTQRSESMSYIPKGAYVLYAYKGEERSVVFPQHYDGNGRYLIRKDEDEKRPNSPWVFDYNDVIKFIKEQGVAGNYERVIIAKVVEQIEVALTSVYNDKKD